MKNLHFITVGLIIAIALFGCKKKGCTYADATNYNSEAKKDDGSCVYESETETEKTASKVIIKQVIINSFPYTDATGNLWDSAGLADCGVKIKSCSGCNSIFEGVFYNNVPAPIVWGVVPNITLNIEENLIVSLYDADGTEIQYMGFAILSVSTYKETQPTSIDFDYEGYEFTVIVDWIE